MARRTETVVISAGDPKWAKAYERDVGKTFILTEMPASQAERWAGRALLALVKAGVEIPDDIAEGGMASLAGMGIRALGAIDFYDLEPLLDEMWACIQIKEPALIRSPTEDDVQEVATRVKLRGEVWKLHTGFLPRADLSAPTSGTKTRASSGTRTSRKR